MSVCQLKGVQVNTSKNQADAFFTEDARSGVQKAVLGTNSRKLRQFSLINREFGSPAGAPDSCVTQGFSRQGKAHPEEGDRCGKLNTN